MIRGTHPIFGAAVSGYSVLCLIRLPCSMLCEVWHGRSEWCARHPLPAEDPKAVNPGHE